MCYCSMNEKSLIVTTINPIRCSRPLHPGTKKIIRCSLKSKEHITNQVTCCLDFQSSMFSISLGLDTLFFLQSILTLIV